MLKFSSAGSKKTVLFSAICIIIAGWLWTAGVFKFPQSVQQEQKKLEVIL